jgi:phosphatidylserine/phosphatidylglycerophosphate/cardiolipin synthase-like enzyme
LQVRSEKVGLLTSFDFVGSRPLTVYCSLLTFVQEVAMFRRVSSLLATFVLSVAGLTLLLARPMDAAGPPSVVIDAVLYDGYESDDADEAVRIRNVSQNGIDVSGWQVNDGESSTAVLPLTTTLPSNQSFWLAKNGVAFQRQFGFAPDFELADTLPGVPNLAGTWPSLSNSGDQLLLLDTADNLMDCLAYEDNPDADCGPAWSGPAVEPYSPSTSFADEGQILYRVRDQQSGLPLADTSTAADWVQGSDDVINGRKVMYPGWDLDTFFWTVQVTETAVLTIAIAPDNAYEAIVAQINSAHTSIQIETHSFENLGVAGSLLNALARGVTVNILMEAEPPGGVDDHERYICQLLELAGGRCYFMFNESDLDIYDRYTYIHAKFILIDGERVIVSSENLSPRSLPYDDKSDGTWGRRGVVLITDAPGVVSHVQSVFDEDFDLTAHADITGSQIIGMPPPDFVPITQTGGISYSVRYFVPTAVYGTFAFELVQSPENSLRDQDSLLGLLNRAGAGDEILVQQLEERPYWGPSTSNPTDDPNPRLEAYIAAARRGATVRLLLDSYFDTANPVSNTATCDYVNTVAATELLDMVCKLGNPTGEGIHNKMVLVLANGRGYIHIGSINGSELSSKGNRELALQVQSDAAHSYLSRLFWQDWGYFVHLPLILNHYLPPADYPLISEVLYNPLGSEDDNEFIELVNPTPHIIDLSNYSLGDAVNPTDFEDVRRFPAGTQIMPGQTLVVATTATAFYAEFGFNPNYEILESDPLVADLVDDLAWGDPNAFLRLGNTGDEVILRSPQDQIVDAMAYGDGVIAGVSSCALVSASHYSLERYPYWQDTNNCLADFREWAFPNPGTLP